MLIARKCWDGLGQGEYWFGVYEFDKGERELRVWSSNGWFVYQKCAHRGVGGVTGYL